MDSVSTGSDKNPAKPESGTADETRPLGINEYLRGQGLSEDELDEFADEFASRYYAAHLAVYGRGPSNLVRDQRIASIVLDKVWPGRAAQPTDNTGGDVYMLVGDRGEPVAVVDMEKITDEGTNFAFTMAAHSNNPAVLDRIQATVLQRVGVEAFGYVAANALRVMTQEILSPSFDVAAAHGTDLRAGMKAIAEGRDPVS